MAVEKEMEISGACLLAWLCAKVIVTHSSSQASRFRVVDRDIREHVASRCCDRSFSKQVSMQTA